jgi:3' terminal RNA ribose 2'-O-methyltransferase Hen1
MKEYLMLTKRDIEKKIPPEQVLEKSFNLDEQRLDLTVEQLKQSGAKTVLDLGCGQGKLLRRLLREKQFTRIVGMDISYWILEYAKKQLHYDAMSPQQKQRLTLFHGSLTDRDSRLEGFDAAAIIEVIEHLDPIKLMTFEGIVFEYARPHAVIITTPNIEYNIKFESLPVGELRYADHYFEWTRKEFQEWANIICQKYEYTVTFLPVGPKDEVVGAPTQMAIFYL